MEVRRIPNIYWFHERLGEPWYLIVARCRSEGGPGSCNLSPMQNGFSPGELRLLRRLDTPFKIQRFLDDHIRYNLEPKGPTCHSPRMVMREGVAHCMEGALFAAAALRLLGHPPLLVDMEAVRDTDHVLAVYRVGGRWGALAKSNYSGLRSREPVYRTVRELAMSYFEDYYNPQGEKTLRTYSRAISLRRFDRIGWMTAERDVWEIAYYLCEISHARMFPRSAEKRLSPMDKRLLAANNLGKLSSASAAVSIRTEPRPRPR